MFSSHIKTKTHEKWLQDLNTNKANFYIENQKLKDVVQSQKIMIGKMDIEILNKIMTIDYLTQQLTKTSKKLKKESEEKITTNVWFIKTWKQVIICFLFPVKNIGELCRLIHC